MLSKLSNARKETRANGNEFYVCTFVASIGDKDAETFITLPNGMKVLNPKAAAIREITLTKCLFPTEDKTAKAYAAMLDAFIYATNNGGKFKGKDGKEHSIDEFTFCLPLLYVTVPVVELTGGVEKVYYLNADGEEKELINANSIGYSTLDENYNDLETWDNVLNGGDAKTVIKRNFDNNVANGTYYFDSIKAQSNDKVDNDAPFNNAPI